MGPSTTTVGLKGAWSSSTATEKKFFSFHILQYQQHNFQHAQEFCSSRKQDRENQMDG